VIAGCAVCIGGAWNMTNVGAIADELAAAYSTSLLMVGAFTAALFLGHSASQIPAGHVIDRVGPRTPALFAIALTVGAGLAAMIAPTPALALVARVVAGVATGLSFVSGTDFLRRYGGTALDQGVFGAVGLGTGGIALVVVPALYHAIEWRAPFLSAAVVGACVLPFVLAGPRMSRADRAARRAGVQRIPRDPLLLRFALMHASSLGFAVVVANWVVPLLTREDLASLWVAGVVGSLVLTIGAIGRTLGGWLARRAPERTQALLAAAMVVAGLATVLLALVPPLPVVVVLAIIIGVAGGIPFGPALYGAGRSFPDYGAAAVGVVNTFSGVVIAVATAIVAVTFALPVGGRLGFALVGVAWMAVALRVPPSAEFRITARSVRREDQLGDSAFQQT
jgi:MFS family permease